MKRILSIICPAALALLASWLFVLFPVSLSLFNTSQSLREQYHLIDAFTVVKNNTKAYSASSLSDNQITVVDLSDVYSRSDIADLLELVLDQQPLAIGFDIALFEKKDSVVDARLEAILSDNPSIIIPCQLLDESAPGSRDFLHVSRQFFLQGQSFPATNEASANVDREGVTATVRHFTPSLSLNGTEIASFPVRILRQVAPDRYDALVERGGGVEYINYRKSSFVPVDGTPAVLQKNLDLCKGRIVLFGDLADELDKFNTPLDSRMPGVVLHAMTLDSLLRGSLINETPDWLAWVLAFLIASLLIPVGRYIKKKTSWSGVLIPILQTVFILFFIVLSYWVFAWFHLYIQPIYVLLAVGFLGLADSLYGKIVSLFNKKAQ